MFKNKPHSRNHTRRGGRPGTPRATERQEKPGIGKLGARRGAERGGRRLPGFTAHLTPLPGVVFMGTARGFGFVAQPDGGEDVFIPASRTMGALDGDTVDVMCRPPRVSDGMTRIEGEVSAIVTERSPYLIGTVAKAEPNPDVSRVRGRESGRKAPLILIPDNNKLALRPVIIGVTSSVTAPVRIGDKIEVMLEARPSPAFPLGSCRVTAVFGAADSQDANYQAILADVGVPVAFGEGVEAEAAARAMTPLTAEGRVRRRETIFTIDGADAKDLDDAVSLTALPHGCYRLGVHIADVSAYVLPGSRLDASVMERGTSLYFTDKVVPMLPTALSNGACSLNAGEDKWALSAILTLNEYGDLTEVRLEKSIIRSAVRGVYSEVNDVIAHGEESAFYDKYRKVAGTIRRLTALYEVLHTRRIRLGGLELDRPEAQILLNEEGHPTAIVRRERGIAERIIEECMLMANEGVARVLLAKERPCVYRVHGVPTEEHVRDFLAFAQSRGLDVSGITPPYTGLQFANAMRQARDLGIQEPISYLLLRTMEKAKYSEIPSPHFGLGLSLYCHFTSPIRRLSDLATHRIISEMLAMPEESPRLGGYAARAAAAATEAERRALTAERRIESLYKTVYMADHVGEEFDAQISAVTSFGIFAELENTCEGLIPLEALGVSPVFDEQTRIITAGDVAYRIGDSVRIRVEIADIAASRVTFALVAKDNA